MLAADDYTKTRYPIVLVHGLFGFDAVGPFEYWYGVAPALSSGGATVYTSQVSAANATEVRGEQLLAELKRLQATYGHTRFNLVGHSHGGPTARYVASVAPGLVASVTTVGAPHAGSKVADDLSKALETTGTSSRAGAVFDAFASLISRLSGSPALPQSSISAMRSLTTSGMADFNTRFPAGKPSASCGQGAATVNGVRYYSIGGASVLTNALDPSDTLLGLTSLSFKGAANDGLVERCSSHWGTVLRDDYPWNHADQINHAFGLRGWFTPDPLVVYRAQANRLKNAGL
ncbi:lipase family alpha/beta hydrolase [Aquabacterium humicola]|uniref:lipase family alpha/beta hydrolase n=1 Tax=Aquabacterium humicola TaxID=3237377 RepID=UPI0025437912|nr:triacylglycerol lipase [Rubrivivax pictus]